MLDQYNRNINYLRISVTDRCNLRCTYCMPEEGVDQLSHDDILSFEEIVDIIKVAVKKGIDKIRLTGGEPLVRSGIIDLVRMIKSVDGVKELVMTTNGILLSKYAKELADAGLDRVNVSLDTTNTEKYYKLTRGGEIQKVFEGIQTAIQVGLNPVKLNCVVMSSSDEEDARKVAEYANTMGLEVRYIHQMDLKTGKFSKVEGGDGGNCSSCNRIRLTANGCIKPCLFNSIGINVKQYGIEEAFEKAVICKPKSGTRSHSSTFFGIGG